MPKSGYIVTLVIRITPPEDLCARRQRGMLSFLGERSARSANARNGGVAVRQIGRSGNNRRRVCVALDRAIRRAAGIFAPPLTTAGAFRMNRRRLVHGLLALPAFRLVAVRSAVAEPVRDRPPRRGARGGWGPPVQLTPSGPVMSAIDGQIIENLDVSTSAGTGITVVHRNVTVRHCRIRHAGGHGVHAEGAAGLHLEDLEIDHTGAPPVGAASSERRNNLDLDGCPGAIIIRVTASRGSSNIYLVRSRRAHLSFLELHDARGPMPRGQNVQFNRSPDSLLEDFSAENSPLSWTEDNISVFRSDRCTVRRGLVSYNNSPTGDGVMIEGSSHCLVEDVDAVQQGNGAFAAVPQGDAECGDCTFRRCRTRDTYNAPRDGRSAPSSNGLSFYTRISAGAQKHTITDCRGDALANPNNLLWDASAVNEGWSIRLQPFAARRPIRLAFDW